MAGRRYAALEACFPPLEGSRGPISGLVPWEVSGRGVWGGPNWQLHSLVPWPL